MIRGLIVMLYMMRLPWMMGFMVSLIRRRWGNASGKRDHADQTQQKNHCALHVEPSVSCISIVIGACYLRPVTMPDGGRGEDGALAARALHSGVRGSHDCPVHARAREEGDGPEARVHSHDERHLARDGRSCRVHDRYASRDPDRPVRGVHTCLGHAR